MARPPGRTHNRGAIEHAQEGPLASGTAYRRKGIGAIVGGKGLPGPDVNRPDPGKFGKRSWEPAATRPGAVCAAGSHGYLV